MKTRLSFVSNSSTTSFVVKRYSEIYSKSVKNTFKFKRNLTPKQEEKLLKFGFKKNYYFYPHHVERTFDKDSGIELKKTEDKYLNFGYYVICNEDEVFEFLIKNRISFTSSHHYNHESIVYDGKTDRMIIAQNLGRQLLMSGDKPFEFGINNEGLSGEKLKEAIVRTTGKEYIK
jgi:hypothetical protein